MQVLYFDYFHVTEKLNLYSEKYLHLDGVVILKDSKLHVFFQTQQADVNKALDLILDKVDYKGVCVSYSEHICDMFDFILQ
jgi:hypothetical protein